MREEGSSKMSREEFVELRDLIVQRTGIYIRDTRVDFLEYRIFDRMQATHTPTVRDYYYLLRYNEDANGEMQSLINAITVQETHFNRNPAQIRTFRDVILPQLLERRASRGERNINLWSAACATGEEPYTLAIALLESKRMTGVYRTQVHASDISTRAIHLAERAIYSSNKLRDYDPATIEKYFQKTGDRYSVGERVRQMVQFSRINLVRKQDWVKLPPMDIVFCRNVFIYFDNESKQRTAQMIYDKLKPGGYVFLGNAETIDVSSVPFKMRFMEGGMVYEKPWTEGP